MKNFIVGVLIYTAMAVVAVIVIAAVGAFGNAMSSPRQAPPSTHSSEQSSNNGTTPKTIKSWRFNNCQYTLFEVDGHEYLQVLYRSYAISLIHHAGCPCMKK